MSKIHKIFAEKALALILNFTQNKRKGIVYLPLEQGLST